MFRKKEYSANQSMVKIRNKLQQENSLGLRNTVHQEIHMQSRVGIRNKVYQEIHKKSRVKKIYTL